jgi:peptidoglycan/LPS O-acetylase OafA/YrhL
MDAIALGCLTAVLVCGTRFSRSAARGLGAAGSVLLIFILCFSTQPFNRMLERNGLDMSIIAIGACMIAAAAAQTRWQAPRLASPIWRLGERSYEVYLTHMFVLFALLEVFVEAGKPMSAVPLFFAAAILISGVLGAAVARFYSEPMNRSLRKRFGHGAERLGSVVDDRQLAGSSR